MSATEILTLAGVIASAASSVVALFLSARANRIGSSAYRLAADTRTAETLIVLVSERTKDGLSISAADRQQVINNMTLFFPRALGIQPIALTAPSMILYDTGLTSAVSRYWDSRTPAVSGHAVVRQSVPVPVVIVVQGYSRGAVQLVAGMYDLYCGYIRAEDGRSQLTVQGLAFANFLAQGQDPQATADSLLQRLDAFLVAPMNQHGHVLLNADGLSGTPPHLDAR
jgi:hypothetical protein